MTIKAVVFDAYGTLYDIQSVAAVTEQAFPGYGEIITQIWRIKQLEYTWLRSLMRRYEDFSVVTRQSLIYTLRILGLKHDDDVLERIMEKYLHLDLYPDASAALARMRGCKLAILSNGSPEMLNALVRNSGLDRVLDATISIDSQEIFKPAPDAYSLIEATLGVRARRGAVRVVEPVGRLRRQGVRPERRLDRAGDAGSDGAGLRRKRRRRAADHVQGDPDADGRARIRARLPDQGVGRTARTFAIIDLKLRERCYQDAARIRQHFKVLTWRIIGMNLKARVIAGVLLVMSSSPTFANGGLITKASKYTVQETIERFEAAIKSKTAAGWVIFSRIDHAAAAKDAGLEMRPRTVIVFGNPKAGTPQMTKSATLAIDLPMKALVWQDDQDRVWLTYNSSQYSATEIYPRHGLSVPDEAVKMLEKFLADASDHSTQ